MPSILNEEYLGGSYFSNSIINDVYGDEVEADEVVIGRNCLNEDWHRTYEAELEKTLNGTYRSSDNLRSMLTILPSDIHSKLFRFLDLKSDVVMGCRDLSSYFDWHDLNFPWDFIYIDCLNQ